MNGFSTVLVYTIECKLKFELKGTNNKMRCKFEDDLMKNSSIHFVLGITNLSRKR